MGDQGDIVIVTTDPDPWTPDAVCDRCGRRGTVARSTRRDAPGSPTGRYCGACWPEQRAEQARRQVEEGALYSTVRRDPAVTWGQLVALVGAVERLVPPDAGGDPRRRLRRRAALASLAAELRHDARRLGGRMPDVVREFIERSMRPAV
jgi:hypothetical protein